MSKAFTREDDLPEPSIPRRPLSSLPSGAKNYLTPDGARRLRAELGRLVETERPRVPALPDPATAKEQLRVLDERIEHLTQSLGSAVIVDPPAGPENRVRFGATVTVRERSGEESRYRIVGVDEADADRGWVSWLSPIARALVNAQLGHRVTLKLPSGVEELEIISIIYESG